MVRLLYWRRAGYVLRLVGSDVCASVSALEDVDQRDGEIDHVRMRRGVSPAAVRELEAYVSDMLGCPR